MHRRATLICVAATSALVGLGLSLAGPSLLSAPGVVKAFQAAKLEVRVSAQDERAPQANVVQYRRWVAFSSGKGVGGEIYEFGSLADLNDSRNLYASDATREATFHKNIALLLKKSVPGGLAAKFKAALLKQ